MKKLLFLVFLVLSFYGFTQDGGTDLFLLRIINDARYTTQPVFNNDLQIASVGFVNEQVSGATIKEQCDAASTENIAIPSTLITIDGYVTQVGDRVLLKDQTTQAQNGIYVASSGTT